MLQDLPNRDKRQPFGGLHVLLGGDFRQIPPVLRRVDINEFPAHTLKACDWWVLDRHVKRYKLVRNKRAEADPEYAAMILQIGDGEFDQDRRRATTSEPGATDTPQAAISLPDKFLAKQQDDLAELIDWTYGDWMNKQAMTTVTTFWSSFQIVALRHPQTKLPKKSTTLC